MTYWSPGPPKGNGNGINRPGFEEAKRQLNARGKIARKGMEFGPSCAYFEGTLNCQLKVGCSETFLFRFCFWCALRVALFIVVR